MSKRKDKLAVKSGKQFLGIAEKIVEGLLEQGYGTERVVEHPHAGDTIYTIEFQKLPRHKVIEVVAEAIKRNLTYGNLATMTLRNNEGQITAKLYIMPDGTLADDSWLCNKGWKK